MDNKQATEIVLSIFVQMSSEQRRQLVKVLRAVRKGMDFKYPNGYVPLGDPNVLSAIQDLQTQAPK